MVLVTARAGDQQGIGWSYAPAAAGVVVADILGDVVIDRSACDVTGAAEAMARAVRNIGRADVAAANLRHIEYFHDHQRIERLPFDGTLDPLDGVLSPEPGRPGLGLELRTTDAEKYRRL